MPLNLITANGEVISTDEGGPFQYTPGGFNSGLAANSVSLSSWDGAGASYSRMYETQPWVAIAVNFLTRQISRLPLKVYEYDSQGAKKRVKQGPLYDAITKPAKRAGPVHLKQWMFFPTLLHGNGTVRKIRLRSGATPIGFEPLGWRNMEPRRIGGKEIEHAGQVDYWIKSGPGRTEIVDVDDVVHLSWLPPNGFLGISPLKQLGVTLRIESTSKAYQEALFRNSARPSGGVTLPENELAKDREYRAELREDLAMLHQGTANAGRPIVLPPGSKWQQFSITAHEADLMEQRKANKEEVVASYNAPQPLVGILDHATYSNISELHRILYGPVLGPWIVLGEETFVAQVLADEPAFEGQFVEFDLSEELRGDVLKEAMALKTQLAIGVLTINEARDIRNLPKIDHPDCDRPMIQANNTAFVGGEPEPDAATKAITTNLERLGERLFRKARAGENGWDPERFRRELSADLTTAKAGHPDQTAETWSRALDAIVTDALNDPDQIKASFAALLPTSNGGPS